MATGRFFAAFQYRLVIQYPPMMLQVTAGPLIAELLGNGETEYAGRIYYKILGATVLSLSCVSVFMGAFSSPLLGLFGKGFHGDPILFASVMAYAVTFAGNNLAGMALQMHGRAWIAFRAETVAALVTLIMAFVLTGRYQDAGTAVAIQLGAIASAVIYMGSITRKKIGALRYAVVVLLAPQASMLLAYSRRGIRSPDVWLGGIGIIALLAWLGAGWFRQIATRPDAHGQAHANL
jgi:O-antigen/teichoic acid export membrane protein